MIYKEDIRPIGRIFGSRNSHFHQCSLSLSFFFILQTQGENVRLGKISDLHSFFLSISLFPTFLDLHSTKYNDVMCIACIACDVRHCAGIWHANVFKCRWDVD